MEVSGGTDLRPVYVDKSCCAAVVSPACEILNRRQLFYIKLITVVFRQNVSTSVSNLAFKLASGANEFPC